MKRVLVTGAGGFIGRHTLPHLVTSGHEVHALTHGAPPKHDEHVFWHRADLLRPGDVERTIAQVEPTHLLHLAWETTPNSYWHASENVLWVRATIDLAEAFLSAGGQRLVGAGSCAEYDWTQGVCHEATTPCVPRSLYGFAKHATQRFLEARARSAGASFAWGRLFHLYGPGERSARLVPQVIQALMRAEEAAITSGDQERDFLYVGDAGSAFAEILDGSVEGAVNIGSGGRITVGELAARIASLMERPELLRRGAKPPRADDPALLVPDVQRLHKEVGWRPTETLDGGLRRTIGWWRQRTTAGADDRGR